MCGSDTPIIAHFSTTGCEYDIWVKMVAINFAHLSCYMTSYFKGESIN